MHMYNRRILIFKAAVLVVLPGARGAFSGRRLRSLCFCNVSKTVNNFLHNSQVYLRPFSMLPFIKPYPWGLWLEVPS